MAPVLGRRVNQRKRIIWVFLKIPPMNSHISGEHSTRPFIDMVADNFIYKNNKIIRYPPVLPSYPKHM